MRRFRVKAVLLALAACAAALWVSGCASTNSENLTETPWNTPKSWETGFPTGMTEERR